MDFEAITLQVGQGIRIKMWRLKLKWQESKLKINYRVRRGAQFRRRHAIIISVYSEDSKDSLNQHLRSAR